MNFAKGSYSQIYVLKYNDTITADTAFLCGNYYYEGCAQLEVETTLDRIPQIIPSLQQQQDKLQFICTTKSLYEYESNLARQVEIVQEAHDCFVEKLPLARIEELSKQKSNEWISENNVYFQMCGLEKLVEDNVFSCSKTYARGLIILSIFLDGVFYFVVSDGSDDQPLLDIRFPDLSKRDKFLQIYAGPTGMIESLEILVCNSKRSIQSNLGNKSSHVQPQNYKTKTSTEEHVDITNLRYEQTYCILKAERYGTREREALFRFNSWCYNGQVDLSPEPLTLEDIPYVIPALRVQQKRMTFFCDAASIPTTTPFTKALEREAKLRNDLEKELQNVLLEPLPDATSILMDGDTSETFFEFNMKKELDENIELMATKSYSSKGVVILSIFFQTKVFITIVNDTGEQPLLDSSFPDLTRSLLGCTIKEYDNNIDSLMNVRSLSVWKINEE